jgi:hypothetical protein
MARVGAWLVKQSWPLATYYWTMSFTVFELHVEMVDHLYWNGFRIALLHNSISHPAVAKIRKKVILSSFQQQKTYVLEWIVMCLHQCPVYHSCMFEMTSAFKKELYNWDDVMTLLIDWRRLPTDMDQICGVSVYMWDIFSVLYEKITV